MELSDMRCFALRNNTKCEVLNVRKCPGSEKCRFYKSQLQGDLDRKTAQQRLASLPMKKQMYIADKYYGSCKVWNKEVKE